MSINFTGNELLKDMNILIKENVCNIEYWGDLDISKNDLEILKDRIVFLINKGFLFKDLFKQYPYALVTYVVFLAKYKYKADFWGMISEEIGIDKINSSEQIYIGNIILNMFDSCGLDYSIAKQSSRKYVDAVIYEIGNPPESNFDDLFYILKYGSMSNVEPQILIDEISSKTHGVHKPLLNFFLTAPEERAVNFVLDIQDTYMEAIQREDVSNKYSEVFYEWLEKDKVKSTYRNKESEGLLEVNPVFFFDNGKKGLCIILPRQNMLEEWVESARWKIEGDDGFCIKKECYVQGRECKRFTDSITVPVKPGKYFVLTFEYNDGFESHVKNYELKGIRENDLFYFDANGRKINHKYLRTPYGIIIYSANSTILTEGVDREMQMYPLLGNDYRIEQIMPLKIDAQMTINTTNEEIVLKMRPQIRSGLSGKKLFNLEYLESEMPIFVEIPRLHLTLEGFDKEGEIELKIGRKSILIDDISLNDENVIDISEGFDAKIYGIHSIRIYKNGNFIKNVKFCLLPDFKSDCFHQLAWINTRDSLKNQLVKIIINKVEDWHIDFTNANIHDLLDRYEVNVPYKEGLLIGNIISNKDNLRLSIGFELPICAYKYEIISNNGINEKCDIAQFGEGNPWLSVSFYGDYNVNNYTVELVSVNGIEQKTEIKLSKNGSANIDLSIFRDTVQSISLPAKIRVVNSNNSEYFDVLLVDELAKFSFRPKYSEKIRCIGIKDEDVQGTVILEKYGDDFKLKLDYNESIVNEKGVRLFRVPDNTNIVSGYYRIVREDNVDELFAINGGFEITLQKDQFFLKSQESLKHDVNFGRWIENFIYNLIKFRRIDKIEDLKKSESYILIDKIEQFADYRLSENDIANLVFLGNLIEAKLPDIHKNIVLETMVKISEKVLSNEERYKIIERLVLIKADINVFNICKNNYCLMLLEIPEGESLSHVKELAANLEPLSRLFSLQMLLKVLVVKTYVTLREILGYNFVRTFKL